jgi:hypoxanthine phosphoribosyltransferase
MIKKISFKDIEQMTITLVNNINEEYDYILGISTGGLYLYNQIILNKNPKAYGIIQIKRDLKYTHFEKKNIFKAIWTGFEYKYKKPIVKKFPLNISNKINKILIVDDMIDSGKTILVCEEFLKSKN